MQAESKIEAPLLPRQQLQRVMITAGGTGGHIFPGLAVAQILLHKGISVRWVGTEYGLEKEIVPRANIPLHYLCVRGLRGKGIRRYLIMPFLVIKSVWKALRLIKKTQPQLVLSLGGYASGPLALAARLAGVPLVIHEQNAAPGLTNRLLAPIASLVLAGLPNPLSRYATYREVGNPIRSSFVELYKAQGVRRDISSARDVNILIIGGSQGAQKLNQAVPQVLTKICAAHIGLELRVVHQAGQTKVDATQELYGQVPCQTDVVDFIDDMAGAYRWADIVISRAGALTVSEVAAAGVACIFVPIAIAVNDHQTKNAQTLTALDAGLIVSEQELESESFYQALEMLICEPRKRLKIADAALSAAKVDAAEVIYSLMDRLVNPETLS